MDWIQLGPWTSPDEKGFGVCPKFVEASVGYGLMIDPKTGKRFINETGNRKVRADAILAIGHPAIILISETNMKKHVPCRQSKPGLTMAPSSALPRSKSLLKTTASTQAAQRKR